MQCTSLSLIVAPTFFINIDESVSVNAGQSGIYKIENHDNVYSINELNMRSIKRVVCGGNCHDSLLFFKLPPQPSSLSTVIFMPWAHQ